MMAPMRDSDERRTPAAYDENDFIVRSIPGWHAAFYGVVAIVAVIVLLDGGTTAEDGITVGALVLLAVVYTTLGRKGLGQEPPSRPGYAYLAVAYVVTLTVLSRSDVGFFLLFLLFPQTFWLIERLRAALAAIAVLCLGIAWAIWADGGYTRDSASAGLASGAINFSISALMGWWITGVINQSDQRAALIQELEQTRQELADAHRREGTLAERERLSHEIHDTLAQGFTSILMLAQATQRSLEDPATALERLAMIERTARDNLAEARALVAALAPVDLEAASLADALDRLVARFGEEVGVRTSYDVAGEPRQLPARDEVVLLRAAQEALANVRKHAGATEVGVRLAYSDGSAALEVHDDGRGFDLEDVAGFGLRGMRSRVEGIGGRLVVDSDLGSGTRIRVDV